jgi:hypothetical protein
MVTVGVTVAGSQGQDRHHDRHPIRIPEVPVTVMLVVARPLRHLVPQPRA